MTVSPPKKLFILFAFFSITTVWGQAPGNISANLRTWLKANDDVFENNGSTAEDNDAVRRWADQSNLGNDATNNGTVATRPIYQTAIINGYPALEFNGNQFLVADAAPGIGNTEDFMIFLVFKQDSYTSGGTTDGSGAYIIDRYTETENLASFKMVNGDKYFYQRRQNNGNELGGPVSLTSANSSDFVIVAYYRDHQGGSAEEGIYINGALDVSQVGPTGSMSVPRLQIGRHAVTSGGGLNGYFAEMAIYDNSILSASNRRRIESYLAIKYGITLDPSVDYVRSGGSIIYPSTSTHSGYVHNIAGIGRDDDSGLNHPTSRSQNLGNMVTVSNPSDLDNNEFLVWGDNNGDLAASNRTDVGPGIDLRLIRVWRARTTGASLGTVSVTIDLSGVPGAKVASDLRLLVDSDGIFNNATAYSVSTSSGEAFTFNNVTIGNDNYFTIGSANATSTPLPVELTTFDVTHEPPIVVATWETASELNNDLFTLERAGEDLAFYEVARQAGAGTSSVVRTYSAIDPHPFGGRSYYRLKQTDYDGTSTYSDIRSIKIDETDRELVLFPNPSDGRNLNFTMGNSVFLLHEVEVLNSQGSLLERSLIHETGLRNYTVELQRSLASGLYLVRVNYNGRNKAFRMIVP